jgi:hypothetical protein
VHALRAAFAVQFDEQNPGRVIALKELLGHARVETTMVYLRRKNKALEMESVRGLSWGSVFPHNAVVPPAGAEPSANSRDFSASAAARYGPGYGRDRHVSHVQPRSASRSTSAGSAITCV